MKFTCTQENLLRALGQVAPITGRNTQLPVLQHVLIEAREGTLHLTVTDLEVGIHTMIGGKIDQPGNCTVPARKLLDYIQQLPATHPLKLEKKNNQLFVTTPGFRAQFPTSDPEDFPLLPAATHTPKITLEASVLARGLGRTIFAAAREETRPEIHSVYWRGEGGQLRLAATDSFRLAEDVITFPAPGGDFSLLLPLNCASELVRLLPGQSQISLSPHDNYVVFLGEGLEISSRLVDGQYPDYQQIIPSSWRTKITLQRDELIRALKTLTVFLPRDSRRVRLVIKPPADQVIMSVGGGEVGEGEVELPLRGEGPEVEILFNIQYILEGLQHLNGKEVELSLNGTHDPVVVRAREPAEQYLYVVMPIQL